MPKCTKHLSEYSEASHVMTARQLQLQNEEVTNVDWHRDLTRKRIQNQCKSPELGFFSLRRVLSHLRSSSLLLAPMREKNSRRWKTSWSVYTGESQEEKQRDRKHVWREGVRSDSAVRVSHTLTDLAALIECVWQPLVWLVHRCVNW